MVGSKKLKKIILEGSETKEVALHCDKEIAINILINLKENNNDNIELCYNKNRRSAYFIQESKNSETKLECNTKHDYYKIVQSNEYESSNNPFVLVSPEASADEPQTPEEQQHVQDEGNSPADYSDGAQQQAAAEAEAEGEGEASAGVDEEAIEASVSMSMVTPYELDDDLDDFLSADEFDSAEEGDFDDDNEEE